MALEDKGSAAEGAGAASPGAQTSAYRDHASRNIEREPTLVPRRVSARPEGVVAMPLAARSERVAPRPVTDARSVGGSD